MREGVEVKVPRSRDWIVALELQTKFTSLRTDIHNKDPNNSNTHKLVFTTSNTVSLTNALKFHQLKDVKGSRG